MSDSYRHKNICKTKRLTGEFDEWQFDISYRYGNKRKSVRNDKIRERQKNRRIENRFDIESD